MGLKFEYTMKPIPEHWDADHFIRFERRGAPTVDDFCIDMASAFKLGDEIPGRGSVRTQMLKIPTWEEDLKDRLIPIVSLAFTTAILEAVKAGSTTLVLSIPSWISVAALIIVLGDIARRHIWKDHPESKLMNIRLLCPNQEIHDGLARYFQGTWELP